MKPLGERRKEFHHGETFVHSFTCVGNSGGSTGYAGYEPAYPAVPATSSISVYVYVFRGKTINIHVKLSKPNQTATAF
jgi:hypothetical protein